MGNSFGPNVSRRKSSNISTRSRIQGEGALEEPLLLHQAKEKKTERNAIQRVGNAWKWVKDAFWALCEFFKRVSRKLLGGFNPLDIPEEVLLERMRLKDLSLERFDPESQEHIDMMQKLWDITFPGLRFEGLVNTKWEEMGWQGKDPSTDFRGGGLLSVQNLIYLSDRYPEHYHCLLHKIRGPRMAKHEYPFAVAGVNLTYMLLELLEIPRAPECPKSVSGRKYIQSFQCGDQESFWKLYCYSFVLLDKEWIDMKADYMDFPRVMERVRLHVTELVQNGSATDMEHVLRQK